MTTVSPMLMHWRYCSLSLSHQFYDREKSNYHLQTFPLISRLFPPPGYFSWRNNVDGSWFIQALVRVLQQHAGNLDLLTMLTIVNKHVAYDFQSCTDDDFTTDMKQMPNIVSTLTKSVMFTARWIGYGIWFIIAQNIQVKVGIKRWLIQVCIH